MKCSEIANLDESRIFLDLSPQVILFFINIQIHTLLIVFVTYTTIR